MRNASRLGFSAAFLLAASATIGMAGEPDHARRPLAGKQAGKASIYSSRLQGRHMSDGQRFNVASSSAASKTLPLGTKARVTDLKTRKSADVIIKDRGPVPRGRVIDLTPHTAHEIGLTRKQGLAPVTVTPVSMPPAKEADARP